MFTIISTFRKSTILKSVNVQIDFKTKNADFLRELFTFLLKYIVTMN